MATPSAVPVCRAVLLRPEASPASCSATPASAATVAVTKARPIPRPHKSSPMKMSGKQLPCMETCVSASDLAAMSARPVAAACRKPAADRGLAGDRAGRGPDREHDRDDAELEGQVAEHLLGVE